ncbi:MAG: hypothetical protein L6301_14270 [Desulfobacteraceae bacterium]|nr:hypothetical protein [Desulfobacteraceae bacterium]
MATRWVYRPRYSRTSSGFWKGGGNNAVDMKVAVQFLIPRVQDGHKPDLLVETVFGKLLQGITGRPEQNIVNHPGVVCRKRIDLMGKRKHHMKVMDGQKLGGYNGDVYVFMRFCWITYNLDDLIVAKGNIKLPILIIKKIRFDKLARPARRSDHRCSFKNRVRQKRGDGFQLKTTEDLGYDSAYRR